MRANWAKNDYKMLSRLYCTLLIWYNFVHLEVAAVVTKFLEKLSISMSIFSARRKPTCRRGEKIRASSRPRRHRLHRGNRLVVCLVFVNYRF